MDKLDDCHPNSEYPRHIGVRVISPVDHCRQKAERVLSPAEKEAWLKLAIDWLIMTSGPERSADHFGAIKRARGML